MKLWLLDADVIIDLLSFGLFDTLVERNDVYASTIVIGEVKSFRKDNAKMQINFRKSYIDTGKITEEEATADEVSNLFSKIPLIWQQTLHAGEIESLSILTREENLTICSCDAATICALPFLDASDRGISVEKLIQESGLPHIDMEDKHTVEYFKDNLEKGKIRWIESI